MAKCTTVRGRDLCGARRGSAERADRAGGGPQRDHDRGGATRAMAPLPRWSDSVFRAVLLVGALVVLGVPTLLMAWVRTDGQNEVGIEVEQPIEFDHRHHARDDGIRCLYCHHEAERGPTAGVPDTALCMGCHNQIWNDSPQTAPIRESWDHRTPIRWRRVTRLPDFVFFDHSAHVSNGVGCETCHGRVDLMASVDRKSVV